MKDFTDNKDWEDDDELSYKVTGRCFSKEAWNELMFWNLKKYIFWYDHIYKMLNWCFFMQRQLLQSLRKKLGVLREAQRGLQEDIKANSQLGDEVGSNYSRRTLSYFQQFWCSNPKFQIHSQKGINAPEYPECFQTLWGIQRSRSRMMLKQLIIRGYCREHDCFVNICFDICVEKFLLFKNWNLIFFCHLGRIIWNHFICTCCYSVFY